MKRKQQRRREGKKKRKKKRKGKRKKKTDKSKIPDPLRNISDAPVPSGGECVVIGSTRRIIKSSGN
jgi:hypothetical protein